MFDIVVIGGGPAGVMASIAALKLGKKVLLIEKNEEILKKLMLTGGGRWNVTNNKTNEQLISQVHNGSFLFSSLNNFNYQDIVSLFLECGIELKEEDHGRMFPVSNKSSDISDALKNILKSYKNFSIVYNQSVTTILTKDAKVSSVTTDKDNYACKSVIIATGGASMPKTGSDGSGFKLAKELGHTLVEPYGAEVPILSNDEFIANKTLQGLSFKSVGIQTKTFKESGYDLIFTHFGLSGPAVLRASQSVYFELKKSKTTSVFIDFMPKVKEEDLLNDVIAMLNANPKKQIKNVFSKLLQARQLMFYFNLAQINPEANCATIAKQKIKVFVGLIKNFEVQVYGTKGVGSSFVTGGGVSLSEVEPKTMESKLVKGLFFAGEVLDLHAHTGGYNITVAFSTGFTAGSNA